MTNNLQERESWIEFHRKIAVSLFNQVWGFMEKDNRTVEEEFLMIHKAHASRFHWNEIGEPIHFSRGEWQISRVYAVLNRPESSLIHAKRNLSICLDHDIKDFDLAFAYEAMARAYSLSDQQELKEKHLLLAQEAVNQIKKEGDRKVLLQDLATIK